MYPTIHRLKSQIRKSKTDFSLGLKMFSLSIIAGLLMANDALGNGTGEISGKVTTVADGNTIEITTSENETIMVLLADIDSPELEQEFGAEAKKFVEKASLRKNVVVRVLGKDRRGNYLAVVLINGKSDLRIELLKNGLAWTSENSPAQELEKYRLEAKSKGKGLWAQQDPVPPWTYRREQSMMTPKGSAKINGGAEPF